MLLEELPDLPVGVLNAVVRVRAELALDVVVLADQPLNDVAESAVPGRLGLWRGRT
jgi:hypothetical protein